MLIFDFGKDEGPPKKLRIFKDRGLIQGAWSDRPSLKLG